MNYQMDLYKWFLYPSLSPETSRESRASFFGICLGTAMIEPPFLWWFSSSLSQSTPLSGKPLAIPPKKMPWICATCSSRLWRPHREWWLAMGVISKKNGCCHSAQIKLPDGFNGGCPALSAQGSLTIRLPLASLSVSLAESWQIFDIFDAGGGQGDARSTYENTTQLVYFDHVDLCCYHMLSWLCVLHFFLRNLAKMSDGETCSSKKGQVNPCSLQLRGDADGKAHCHHLFKGFCFRRTGGQLRNQ